MISNASGPQPPEGRRTAVQDRVVTLLALTAWGHDDDIADRLHARIGFDRAVHALAAVSHPRAGAVLLSLVSASLVDAL